MIFYAELASERIGAIGITIGILAMLLGITVAGSMNFKNIYFKCIFFCNTSLLRKRRKIFAK